MKTKNFEIFSCDFCKNAITKTIHMLTFSANKSQLVVNQSSSLDIYVSNIIEPYLMSYSKKDFHAICCYNTTINWEFKWVWRDEWSRYSNLKSMLN